MWSHFEITCAPHSETNCAIYCGTSWVIYFPNHSSSLTVNNNTPKLSSKKADTDIFLKKKNPKLSTQSHGFGKSFNVLQSFAIFLNCELFCEQKQHVVDVSPTAMTSWEISSNGLLWSSLSVHGCLSPDFCTEYEKFLLSWDCFGSCDSTVEEGKGSKKKCPF